MNPPGPMKLLCSADYTQMLIGPRREWPVRYGGE